MKFQYLIISTFDGSVVGTNDDKIAKEFAQAEDYFVLDAKTNCVLIGDETEEIKEFSRRE